MFSHTKRTAFRPALTLSVGLTPLLMALAACSSGSGGSSDSGSTVSAPTSPTSTGALPHSANLTPHMGLEVVNFNNADGSFNTQGHVVSDPAQGVFTSTAKGFDLTIPSATDTSVTMNLSYDTSTGPQPYVNCQTCGGAAVRVETSVFGGGMSTLNYTVYGAWEQDGLSTFQSSGVFAGGTATGQRPSLGTATYVGGVQGLATTAAGQTALVGHITLNADFTANAIGGAITGLTTQSIFSTSGGAGGASNDIALTNGVISGTNFIGNAAALAANANTTLNTFGATGRFGGAFYGPNAAEAGGSLAITVPGVNVIASFGAAR